jgi:hypothetical protein
LVALVHFSAPVLVLPLPLQRPLFIEVAHPLLVAVNFAPLAFLASALLVV